MKTMTAIAVAAATLAPAGLVSAGPAQAAKAKKPKIMLVSPMRVTVGKSLTIKGRNFSRSRNGNKVVLEGAKGRLVIVKPSKASSTKLVLKVPASAERILTPRTGAGLPTRVRLRVVTGKFDVRSGLRQSPVVVSARVVSRGTGSGGPATPAGAAIALPCGSGTDWDADLLDNNTELAYGLNPCSADSDGDGSSDGWEYWSAKDLNVRAVPYPGKKPYPNPLDAGDTGYDFDGDSLTSAQEYRAWVVTGRAFDQRQASSPLGYSDGTQASRPTEAPAVPAFRAAQYGLNQTPPAYPAADQMTADGIWTDEERDADNDGLNNFVETNGPGHAAWWAAALAAEKPTAPEAWPGTDPNGLDANGNPNYAKNYFGEFKQRPFQDLALDDPDADGDTLLDGEDDQDADDVPNYTEMLNPRTAYTNGNRKNAFNPCAPVTNSRTCPRYFPIR